MGHNTRSDKKSITDKKKTVQKEISHRLTQREKDGRQCCCHSVTCEVTACEDANDSRITRVFPSRIEINARGRDPNVQHDLVERCDTLGSGCDSSGLEYLQRVRMERDRKRKRKRESGLSSFLMFAHPPD